MKVIKIWLIAFFVHQACTGQESLSLQLQWLPQAQFAGYLAARSNDFYREAGLNVDIRFGGPDVSPFDSLIQNRVTFCTGWLAEGIARRSKGAPVVNLAQLVQRSGLMLVSKKSSRILKPEDMNGKIVGLWQRDFMIQPTIFFRKKQLQVRVVPQAYSIDAFLRGAFDVVSAMYYNEYHRIYEAGLDKNDIVTFWFADYGLNYPEDGIYCTNSTWEAQEDVSRRFIAASLKGWEWAFSHKQEAVDIVMGYCHQYNMATSRNHQNWMLKAMEELMKAEPNGKIDTQVNPDDFDRIVRGLTAFDILEKNVTYQELCKPGAQ